MMQSVTPESSGPVREPAWVEHVMWWQVYPLGFVGAPVRPLDRPHDPAVVHRLGRIEAWLDHLIDLGLNGLQLGPVFASSSHGYDTIDYFRVDPRLGDVGDLDALIAAARARGIRVLLDGVFNHVGRDHAAFRSLELLGPAAQTAPMFRVRWHGWQPGDRVDADLFEGHEGLVALNHESPAVEDLVVEVMTHWLDRGIDGWRLDAAYAVPPSFWARVLPRVRARHPDAWFSGEVIHGDQAVIVAESTMDSVTQYELWQGIWHAISDRNFYELAHAIQRHDLMLGTFVPSTFVGNHDVTRLATAVGADFIAHAVAILATVAGTPSVWAGDEYGYRGRKEERLGGDDAIRPEFPRHPPDQSTLDAEAASVLSVTRQLVSLRRERPWLHCAHTEVVDVANETIVLRSSSGGDAVLLALSLRDEPAGVPIPEGSGILLGDATLDGRQLLLPARGWAVLVES
jgi:glycosidase